MVLAGRERGARDPIERWRKKRLCQEAWKQRHRGAYLEQKRELAHRPEYLAKRRALYAQKQATIRPCELTGQGACGPFVVDASVRL